MPSPAPRTVTIQVSSRPGSGVPSGGQAGGKPGNGVFAAMVVGVLGLALLLPLSLLSGEELKVAAGLIALIAAVVLFTKPFLGLLAFVALVFIRPEETFPALAGLRLTLLVSAVAMLGMFTQALLQRKPLTWTPLMTAVFGFFLAALGSSLSTGLLMDAAMDVGKLVMVVLLILNLVQDRERYVDLITALIVFTGYLAAYSIYLYATGNAMIYQNVIERGMATGIFSDPNDLAAVIVSGVPLALTRVMGSRGVSRFGYLLVLGTLLAAIYLTHSRGGLLALILVTTVFMLYVIPNKIAAFSVAGTLALGVIAFASTRMRTLDSGEESANMRFWFWDNGVQTLLAFPALGVGYGVFPEHNGGMTAHNTFVLCFAELGMIGYLCFMGALYFCFRGWDAVESTAPAVSVEAGAALEAEADLKRRRRDVMGARLALLGFLAAGFWLSRTYVPVLYVLLALPIAAQVALADGPARGNAIFRRGAWEMTMDGVRIAALSLGSIFIIWLMASRLK